MTESGSEITKLHLTPGEYPMLDFLVDSSLIMKQFVKNTPNVQVYEHTSVATMAQLYPVVANQIELSEWIDKEVL